MLWLAIWISTYIGTFIYANGIGPDIFGYVATDTALPLEPDAPTRPSIQAKQIAQSDPGNTECVQNANTQSFFRCLTIAGSVDACRIGRAIGAVQVCPTSDTLGFDDAFDFETEFCFSVNLTPDANNPFFGPSGFFGGAGFGFTFYGQAVSSINICASGFITFNAPETFTGINILTDARGNFIGSALIEKNFPNNDNEATANFAEGFPAALAAYYTFIDATPDAAVGGSGVYITRRETDPVNNTTIELFIIEYNNVLTLDAIGGGGDRVTFQIVLFGRVFDVTDPQNPIVVDEVDLAVVKYERAISDNSTFRLAGINMGDGISGLTWNSGVFDVFDTAVAYIISLSPPATDLFVNDSIRGAQSGFKGNPVTITTFFPVFSAIFEGQRCERAFAAKIQFSEFQDFRAIACTSDVIRFSREIPRFIRSPNINPSPCQGRIAFKPFVQYFWRIVFWKHLFPQDDSGNCNFTASADEPDRTLYTSTRLSAQTKPDSFIICTTCQRSGTGASLGLPGGDQGGSRAVIGTFTGQGTGGSSGGSCAIATASLGDYGKLELFRLVRNKYISRTQFGLQFLKSYYQYNHYLVDLVKKSRLIKIPFKVTFHIIYSYIYFAQNTSNTLKLLTLIIFVLIFFRLRLKSK